MLWAASLSVTVLALGMLSYDVLLRCLITERPPIKNLYDTFLFIAAVGVLLAVVAEIMLPRRIALAAVPFTGALLVMFARMFEVADGSDTMVSHADLHQRTGPDVPTLSDAVRIVFQLHS